MVSAHTKDRVRSIPCDHNPEEERRVKQRVRRDVEPPEVRRFLRQELLKKVGHSWWNRPRVYRYDKDDERELTQSLRSVVVEPQGQALHQQELSPAVPGDRMTLVGPVASPVTSLPHTLGRDIVVAGSTEESPRTREGRLAAATLEQEMGRRSMVEAIRPIRERAVASSSSAGRTITQEMVAEACDTIIQERHPASPPVWPESSRKRQSSIKRRLEGRNHRRRNWSWPSLMDWTFRPSRRSVICLRGPGPRFTSRGRRSGWSEPPPSGDGRRPRPWHSSWVDEGVNITPAGMALCDNDQSAASMPLISRRTEGCGPPVCTKARSVGCWTDWSPRGPREIESPRA